MKKYILLGLLLSSLGAFHAQSTGNCVQGISTDPDNPVKASPTDPVFHENTFDWRLEWYPARPSYDCNMEIDGLWSPFFSTFADLSGIAKGTLSDFQPADGWELIKRDMGYLMQAGQMSYGTASSNGGVFINPYLILYNRFRGELRVIAALPFNNPGQDILVSLKLRNDLDNLYTGYHHLNGLFSQSTAVARPLDQKTMVQTLASPTAYPDACEVFFFADFHVAYDPCLCYFKSLLDVTFDWVESATFGAIGQSVGVSQDLAYALNSGYDPSQIMTEFWAESYQDSNNPGTTYDSLRSGTYIHARAWELYEKHMKKEEAKGNVDVAGALYFLATAAKVGVVLATKGAAALVVAVSAGTAQFGAVGTASIVANTATVVAAKKFTLEKALKVATPLFDFLSSQFKEDKPAQMSPMAIESEQALRGRIEKTTSLGTSTIRIGVPGSLSAENLPEKTSFNQPAYPTYNEALGLFALLETPRVQRWYMRETDTLVFDDLTHVSHQYNFTDRVAYRLSQPLRYAFNPAAGIDAAHTTIDAMLIVTWDDGYLQEAGPSSLDPWHYVGGPYWQDFTGASPLTTAYRIQIDTAHASGISEPVHTGCLASLHVGKEIRYSRYQQWPYLYPPQIPPPYLNGAKAQVYLRLLIQYAFHASDADGLPLQHVQTLTFPVAIAETGTDLLWVEATRPPVLQDLALTGQHYTTDTEIVATGDISIAGNLTNNGAQVWIRAGGGRSRLFQK